MLIEGSVDNEDEDRVFTVNDLGASDRTPLHRAAGAGHLLLCEYFISLGAKIDAIDRSGRNALHWASISGHCEVISYFLSVSGPDLVSSASQSGMTALHAVVEGNKENALKIILEHLNSDKCSGETRKKCFDSKNSDGKTPWELGVMKEKEGGKTLCQILKMGGADPNHNSTNEGSAACSIS
jgi:serine/threonine-protein phosphatase 6 regulatory ankyrin repeat subunit B